MYNINRHMEKRLYDKIRHDAYNMMKSMLDDGIKYPIEYENELEKFKIESNNKVIFQPKTFVQYINVDFKTTSSSENNL